MIANLRLSRFTYFLPFFVLVTPAVCHASADDLPRHGVIGLMLAGKDNSKPENPETNPPAIKTVFPGSAAEAAGFQPGDLVLKLDGSSISSSAEFASRVASHLAGDQVSVLISRAGAEMTLTATLKPRPYETSPDADVIYSSISAGGWRRRTIITRPKPTGKYPAVLLIGGLGCYSMDGALGQKEVYGPILTALARNHYVTMRVEKTGEGDSEGPACTDPKATAELEAAGYAAGIRALKTLPYVDPTRIFIFAHSLGPLVASLALPQEPVRGFVAAETVGKSWFEYMIENLRRQAALTGDLPDQVDAEVRTQAVCAYNFHILHESEDEVSKISPQCADMIRSYAGVPTTYMQQIGDISLGKQWKDVNIPVLVIYGTSDPATSADEGKYLADIINRLHPGHATYVEIPGMGHDFGMYSSQADFMNRRSDHKPHPYSDEIIPTLLKWLSENS